MAAPDVALQEGEVRTVRLADLWPMAPRATVLVFFRHFG
jgi:hypothetical protein